MKAWKPTADAEPRGLVSSGAEAHDFRAFLLELKLRPPKSRILQCVLAILLVFTLPVVSAAPRPATPQANADAAILQVLNKSAVDWNRGDLPAFLECYQNSPATIYIGAEGVVRGWRQIRERYVKKYGGPDRGRMGHVTFTNIEIHPLGANYALAIGQWHLVRPAASGGDLGGYFTLTFEKTAAGWRIIVDHTS